jgi:ParB family chromosome partitioning protein
MPESIKHSQNNQKKARLGRGMSSLFGGAETNATPATEKRAIEHSPIVTTPREDVLVQATPAPTAPMNEESQIWKLAVDKLRPNTQQPRRVFSPEGLRDLSASIKEKGILQPITARRINEREFEIIAGERRWRAAQMAGLHEVPVILKKVTEQDSLELAIIENIQRENLNPLEEAEAFEHLIHDYQLTQQQIAEKLGKERSSVANTLRLLTLPAEVKIYLKSGEITQGHAKVLLSLDNQDIQRELATQIVAEKLSVRATEKLVLKSKTAQRKSETSADAPNEKDLKVDVSARLIESLSAELQKLIGTKVSIDYSEGKGKISVAFYSDDQLTHIVEKMRRAWEK